MRQKELCTVIFGDDVKLIRACLIIYQEMLITSINSFYYIRNNCFHLQGILSSKTSNISGTSTP